MHNPQALHKLAYLFASEYTKHVHKTFYASGFLFHQESQQILLHQTQQKNDTVSVWSMFGGTNDKEDDGAVTFQQMIYDVLNLKLARKHIYPVYNYFHNVHNTMHYVYYAQVTKMQNYAFEGETLSWFTFKQTLKLPFAQQTKQDIVVAQRVIDLQKRITMHTQHYRPITA